MQKTLSTNKTANISDLEAHFNPYKSQIIGDDATLIGPYGQKRIVYADWTASGRMYAPIESKLMNEIYPFVANTHTETNTTGSCMTKAYAHARSIIKAHVNASDTDVLISSNSGMTGVVNKFQRILGLKIHEKYRSQVNIPSAERPIIFCTHMEHHSNQTSWLETICDVRVIKACPQGLVCLDDFSSALQEYQDRKHKIAAITSCSNVTGIKTPYYEMAKLIHQVGGLCFVDFACSAPYVNIDMHPSDPESRLDAIFFSPHKFLGGPSSAGVLIFDQKLYNNKVPDNPGGGTVNWTNPWGDHKYLEAIEAREDGGTPAFLQTIRTALCIQLKQEMGVDNIYTREKEISDQVWSQLSGIDNLNILADNIKERLPIFSLYIDDLHYNLGVKMLNDRFGIQVRGGCSCAGTYGHYLLDVSQEKSQSITTNISCGILNDKPGWIRVSFHPTMTSSEVSYITTALKDLATHHTEWAKDYNYIPNHNDYVHVSINCDEDAIVKSWFEA